MKVLFAAAELAPLARVGGLAEAASGLLRELRNQSVDVHLVLPDYGDVELVDEQTQTLAVPPWVGGASSRHGTVAGIGQVELVTVPGMSRPHPYVDESGEGWPDNDHRFFSFSAAIAAIAEREQPNLVHLNDWHTAATTAFLPDEMPTVLTVHTLGYQGHAPEHWLERLGPESFRFASWGTANPLAGALQLADCVVAVSPNYASEIVLEENGAGLHQRLDALGDRLIGIRNGIDATVWNPSIDPLISSVYSVKDLAERTPNRAALLADTQFPDDDLPIIGVVSRLVDQKGIEFMLRVADFLPTFPARMVIVGSGDPHLATAIQGAADAQPSHLWFFNGYDESLAHRLFAGTDLFLMPSRFEPCGLAQMQAMAYGSIPIVTDVGGLRDTVIDADRDPKNGTGFVSRTVDDAGVVDATHRAVRAVRSKTRRMAIAKRGMSTDWSWEQPAAQHLAIYKEIAAL